MTQYERLQEVRFQEVQLQEVARCYRNPAYFIDRYCQIYDAVLGEWIRFELWPEQESTLNVVNANRLVVIMKARQLGLTWLVLAFALWLMLFRPASTVLLFSRRDDESVHLLDDRLKGMYQRLPEFLTVGMRAVEDSAHEWQLSNGSVARAFPTTAGDSYTATLAIVDEADLVPNLNALMRAVKPTIDAGGRMILLSRSDKGRPQSEFKRIYRAAKERLTDWVAAFLPWDAHPERDALWYETQRADVLARTGSLDDLLEQYPATDTEAMAARTLDKRIAPAWIEQCYVEMEPLEVVPGSPSIPGLKVYVPPKHGRTYVMGLDPAEGNPTSNDSALTVLDALSGEEVASLAGKIQPTVLAAHADLIGKYYNQAKAMVERNNHGHAVLAWLRDNSTLTLLLGHDGRQGWHTTSLGKAMLYNSMADACRDKEVLLHTFALVVQLGSIDGSSLAAPEGEMDDLADSCALAWQGAIQAPGVLLAFL